ncbi:hypothetical protein D3C72_2100270 [compost metagenome]
MHFVAHHQLEVRQLVARIRVRREPAGQVVAGIEESAGGHLAEHVDALPFVFDGPQVVGQGNARAGRRVLRIVGAIGGHRHGGFQPQQVVQELADGRVVGPDVERVRVLRVVERHAFQRRQRKFLLFAP